MTSRERVLTSLNHKEPDRVPLDFNSHHSSGIAVQAYKNLRKFLGLKESPLYMYDVLQQIAIVEEDVLDFFGIDVIQFGSSYSKKEDYWKDHVLHDGTKCKIPKMINIEKNEEGDYVILSSSSSGKEIAIQKKSCLYVEQTFFPLKDKDVDSFENLGEYMSHIMWCDVKSPTAPLSYGEKDLLDRESEIKKFRSSTESAMYSCFGGNLFETGQWTFGIEKFFMELALNGSLMHKYFDKVLENHMSNLEKFVKYIAPYSDIVGFGDDLGMHSGPQISTEMFCEFFKPRYKIMYDYLKSHAPHVKICLHSCGGIEPLLPHLIEVGLDAVNPVQITCKDMGHENIKKKYGKDITFWGGGCDTRDYLPNKTPKEIKEHVKKNMDIMKEGGGFVFQQVHNILANVPPENIVAMFEAAKEYGKY